MLVSLTGGFGLLASFTMLQLGVDSMACAGADSFESASVRAPSSLTNERQLGAQSGAPESHRTAQKTGHSDETAFSIESDDRTPCLRDVVSGPLAAHGFTCFAWATIKAIVM